MSNVAPLASAGMPYFDRDVAIVMLTDVGMVLEHLAQHLDTPRRTLHFGVQLAGYRLHCLSRRLLVEHLQQEECRVLACHALFVALFTSVLEQLVHAVVHARHCSSCPSGCSTTAASCSASPLVSIRSSMNLLSEQRVGMFSAAGVFCGPPFA